MTDKKPRKRAKSIPVFDVPSDTAALWCYGPSATYDPVLPDNLLAAIPPEWVVMLEMPAFTTVLGAVFGRYRYYEAIAIGEQPAKAALEQTRLAVRVMQEAYNRLHHLPWLAKDLLDLRARTDAQHPSTMLDRAVRVMDVHSDLEWAAEEIDRVFAPHPGRPPDALRDALLTDVRDVILAHATKDCTKDKAAELVQTLMLAARVRVPDGIEDIQKRIRAVERARQQEAAAELEMLAAALSKPDRQT